MKFFTEEPQTSPSIYGVVEVSEKQLTELKAWIDDEDSVNASIERCYAFSLIRRVIGELERRRACS